MLLASVLGVLMGLVMGLTGAGGGILGVPALVLGLGLTMTQAAPVSLLAVGAAAAVGAIDGLRHGLVRYRAALLIALLGALFSPLGVFVAHQLSEPVLMGLFSALMVLVAWRMLQREKREAGPSDHGAASWGQKNCMLNQQTGRLAWTAKCSATLAALGAVTGAVSGLLGVISESRNIFRIFRKMQRRIAWLENRSWGVLGNRFAIETRWCSVISNSLQPYGP